MSKLEQDDRFRAFLEESISEEESVCSEKVNSHLQKDCAGAGKQVEKEPSEERQTTPWWLMDDSDLGSTIGSGRGTRTKMFMKASRIAPAESSHSIGEISNQLGDTASNVPDADSLTEQADKMAFFKELKGNDSENSPNYGEMNKQINLSTVSSTLMSVPDLSEKGESINREKKTILSRVVLLDSLESTLNTTAHGQQLSAQNFAGRAGPDGDSIYEDAARNELEVLKVALRDAGLSSIGSGSDDEVVDRDEGTAGECRPGSRSPSSEHAPSSGEIDNISQSSSSSSSESTSKKLSTRERGSTVTKEHLLAASQGVGERSEHVPVSTETGGDLIAQWSTVKLHKEVHSDNQESRHITECDRDDKVSVGNRGKPTVVKGKEIGIQASTAVTKNKRKLEEEISRLKQENFVLTAKISDLESKAFKMRSSKVEGSPGNEQVKQFEIEMRNQEVLLRGFQKENEKLYAELKELKLENKQAERRLFEENQRLQQQLALISEQKEQVASRRKLMQEAAERTVVRDGRLDAATRQQLLTAEAGVVEARREAESLRKKLCWYAENQQLVDKDAQTLLDKDKEIAHLQDRLRQEAEVYSSRAETQKVGAKERSANARKIQDLQRQIKEMEVIMRKRNPNSVASLIMAANAAASSVSSPEASSRVRFLEERIKKLEVELERKDEDKKKALRAVQQQFTAVQLKYEDQAEHLEDLVYRRRQQVTSIGAQTQTSPVMSPSRTRRQSMMPTSPVKHRGGAADHRAVNITVEQPTVTDQDAVNLVARVHNLTRDLSAKTKALATAEKTCTYLKSERKELLAQLGRSESRQDLLRNKSLQEKPSEQKSANKQASKQYMPELFGAESLADLAADNNHLRDQLKKMSLMLKEEREKQKAALTKAEARSMKEREAAEKKVQFTRDSMEKKLRIQAKQFPWTKYEELKKLSQEQEQAVSSLHHQVAEADLEREQLVALRISHEHQGHQVAQLQQQLGEARKCHSPEMVHYEVLLGKIDNLERSFLVREQYLQTCMLSLHKGSAGPARNKILKDVTLLKDRQIDRFRTELDEILLSLKSFQGQIKPKPAY
ncbi:PREDICTED: centrosomal protein of 162 kDa-like isoform X2 [Priapulus caudatus]|uniref:Centrosomal protein of 162 kDa n=1 Tax=Priapulus caudatus TaxID=37621 RepID=A0ABM1DZ93_PRICU|nr:PREDICTED: centrosomal protein of 162 kDa-like isoform X2 [Priapulus caudatus]